MSAVCGPFTSFSGAEGQSGEAVTHSPGWAASLSGSQGTGWSVGSGVWAGGSPQGMALGLRWLAAPGLGVQPRIKHNQIGHGQH